jgi:ATP-dependent DNA helicase RecQ
MDGEISRKEALGVLEARWGHGSFRAGQWPAIRAVLDGRDVLAILPTGGGKSVCYQLPGLMTDGLTLVVSPLIALMRDQVQALQQRGIAATFVDSTLRRREIEQRWTDARHGRYELLYVAPERLDTERFEQRADTLPVTLLAVDEAHCVSEWGHHFRPSYLEIAQARDWLGGPPTIAVTATATPEVRRDVTEQLALRAPEQIVQGFDRPNLVWSIFRPENKRRKVRDVIEGVGGSGLLYAATRRRTERWAGWLSGEDIPAAAYHAGLESEERERVQEAWLGGSARVVAATNAFGMGIDKPDVRFVIHADVPGSLEAYYQEAGRAGRDGERAHAVLLYAERDAGVQRDLIERSHPEAEAVRQVYEAVCNLAQVPVGEEPETPLAVDYGAVAQLAECTPQDARQAAELLERQEVWSVLPVRTNHALIRFERSPQALRRYADKLSNRALAGFVRTLLRTVHADAFGAWWEIDLRLLERRTDLERPRLMRGLDFLEERDLLGWHPPATSARMQMNVPRTDRLAVDDRKVRRSRRRAEKRLDDMIRYARSVTCRRHHLLTYFGEASPERCGRCDVCLGRHEGIAVTADDEPVLRGVLRRIAEGEPRPEWFDGEPPVSARRLDRLLDWLVQKRYLEVQAPLKEQFDVTDRARDLLQQWSPRE